jgi:hypothetical protein
MGKDTAKGHGLLIVQFWQWEGERVIKIGCSGMMDGK